MKNKSWIQFGCVLSALLFGGCASGPDRTGEPAEVEFGPEMQREAISSQPVPEIKPMAPSDTGKQKVGMIVPLSGQFQKLGEPLIAGAQLALNDTPAAQIELLIEDSKGTPEGATAAFNKLVAQGAGVVLGPLFAQEVRAVSPLAHAQNMAVLSFSNDRQAAQAGIFTCGYSSFDTLDSLIAWGISQRRNTWLILVPQNDFGKQAESHARLVLEQSGRQLVTITYPPQVNAWPTALSGLASVNCDAVIVLEHGARFEAMLKVIRGLRAHAKKDNLDHKIIAAGLWDRTQHAHMAEGMVLAMPESPQQAAFFKHYTAFYNHAPSRLAILAYDLMSLVSYVYTQETARPLPLSAFSNPKGFQGAGGFFRLKTEGVLEASLGTYMYKSGQIVTVSPPLQRFESHGTSIVTDSTASLPSTY